MLYKIRLSSISSGVQSKELFILQRENAEDELEFQRRREFIMEKAKPEVRTCEQGEKWSLSQVWGCLGALNGSLYSVQLCVETIVGLRPLRLWWVFWFCFLFFVPLA